MKRYFLYALWFCRIMFIIFSTNEIQVNNVKKKNQSVKNMHLTTTADTVRRVELSSLLGKNMRYIPCRILTYSIFG